MCSDQCGHGVKKRKIVCQNDETTDKCLYFKEELRECTSKELCNLGKVQNIVWWNDKILLHHRLR